MKNRKKKKIATLITLWLSISLIIGCVISVVFTYVVQSERVREQTVALVRQSVEDISSDMDELMDESILSDLNQFINAGFITTANLKSPDELSRQLQETYSGTGYEVNVVDSNGIIVASSVSDYIGYDMHKGEQAQEFLCLIDGTADEYVQEMRGNSYDEALEMKYAGKRFSDGSGFLELGLTKNVYYTIIGDMAGYFTKNRRIGDAGYILICGEDQTIMGSYHNDNTGKSLKEAGVDIDPSTEYNYVDRQCDVFGVPSYININHTKGLYVIGVSPVEETTQKVYRLVLFMLQVELVLFILLFVTLTFQLRKLIVKNMILFNQTLGSITSGKLDERAEIRSTYEYDTLSNDINATVDRLKDLIREAEERMNAELAVAEEIQRSALPNVFPPFPNQHEFELFASMHAAKEVGGDFYDYYMLGNKLAFIIADVSGKSVPGAMFMMKSKEVIKSLASSGLPPAGIFTMANDELCEGNEAEMFLTAWMGFLDLETGVVNVANAGHNPPILIRDGKAEYVILKPGLMLAGMDGTIYKKQQLQLEKGDILFLYTDGVTEAMDADEELYGEERLIRLLSFGENYPNPSGENGIAGAVCELVAEDVARFVNGAEQSDDITMLCIRYLGA